MDQKLQSFLDAAFAPYGNFPSRSEVTKELLINLQDKYADLKRQGLTDDDAYQATVESFGDVTEIMEQVPHAPTPQPSLSHQESVTESGGFRQAFKMPCAVPRRVRPSSP